MLEPVVDPRLRLAMAEASRNVPLYRGLWSATGIDIGVAEAALLDKSRLRACRPEDRLHSRRRGEALHAERSSGSSGEPMTIYSDGRARRARRLAFLRALLDCGFRPGQRMLLLTSRRRSRWSGVFGWHYADIGEGTPALARRVMALRPRLLYGPLTTLELLAEHFRARGERPPGLALVVSTAEQLTPARLATLEQGLQAPIADFYGMTEFGLVAYRKPGADRYIPARRSLVLEYIPAEAHDALEQLVISDLAERASPLLRYDTGDFVRRDAARPDRPIVAFAGRAFDCILLPSGERLSPYRIDVALEQLPNLRAFEVVQQPDLSIDVTIDAQPRDAERLRGAIAAKLGALLGQAMPLRIASGAIRRGPSGAKFRPIRSLAGAGARA
jgi:phenylacetate-coenzyme A ligase PaaK-like adenylate-forming protein